MHGAPLDAILKANQILGVARSLDHATTLVSKRLLWDPSRHPRDHGKFSSDAIADRRTNKLVAELMDRPSEMDFSDVHRLLSAHGWTESRQVGSHVSFTAPGRRTLVIPSHGRRKVNRTYLAEVRDNLGLGSLPVVRKDTTEYSVHIPAGGGFIISYPGMPGCLTHVEKFIEVAPAAREIRSLWLETQ